METQFQIWKNTPYNPDIFFNLGGFLVRFNVTILQVYGDAVLVRNPLTGNNLLIPYNSIIFAR